MLIGSLRLEEIALFYYPIEEGLSDLGIKTYADLIKWAIEELPNQIRPKFEHFNVYEDHITIRDNLKDRLIHVWIKNGTLVCEFDARSDCEHVGYAWTIPTVIRKLSQAGIKR